MEALASRLAKRGTEAPEERALRLHNAEAEIGHASEFDRAILNDDANRAAAELIALVRERRKARREETE
jgi:guanylate kinase